MTQFAVVEELASLIQDNLPCKHLVLRMEEALVNFLQDDTSSDAILELEPMNSYSRLLLHRLAEIFGFAHESVGEGDYRHLIIQRCPETSIPPILVSDILCQYDEPQSSVRSHQLLRRREASPVSQTSTVSVQHSLEEREAAYSVARERIFSMNLDGVKEPGEQKPRCVPVVARRMIAHALGQRVHPKNQSSLDVQNKNGKESNHMEDSKLSISNSRIRNTSSCNALSHDKMIGQTGADKISPHLSQDGKHGNSVDKEYMKNEHLGAAKRMFAHALGVQSGKGGFVSRSRSGENKQNNTE